MTHTLHRQGSVESLKQDYTVLIADIPFRTYRARLRRKFPGVYIIIKKTLSNVGILKMLRIIERKKPVGAYRQPVFNNKEELTRYLKDLKERNIGKSVVVSGLFDEVNDCLNKLNLSPHTVQFSLGIFGKKELLPKREVLEITTMCGHHMISSRLVEKLTSHIRDGKTTIEEAVGVMNKQCICGVFNKARACKLIEAFAK